MRGTLEESHDDDLVTRFIPAHAGNTSYHSVVSTSHAVHPRACGEHFNKIILTQIVFGSSPRMRGTLIWLQLSAMGYRFIPAHAGNTLLVKQPTPLGPVHPRACGEHCVFLSKVDCTRGSSPRMRGTPPPRQSAAAPPWFIPAHAGNTHVDFLGGYP